MPRNPTRKKEMMEDPFSDEAPVATVPVLEGAVKAMPRRRAMALVDECASQAVQKFVGEFGCEGFGSDLTLAEVFDEERRKGLKTWLVAGHELNKTQIQTMLVNLVADGEMLPSLCAVDGMPNLLTVTGWLEDYPDFAEWMARAERAQATLFMYEAMAIADGTTPKESFVAKLRMDVRGKFASFLDPKKWSPKQMVQVTMNQESPEQLQAQLVSMLVTNAQRYMEMFGLVVSKLDDFPRMVLAQAEFLKSRGIEVMKTVDYKDRTIDIAALFDKSKED